MEHHCDRCGAQAKARYFKAGKELVFCGHHEHEYGKALIMSDWFLDIEYASERNPELTKV